MGALLLARLWFCPLQVNYFFGYVVNNSLFLQLLMRRIPQLILNVTDKQGPSRSLLVVELDPIPIQYEIHNFILPFLMPRQLDGSNYVNVDGHFLGIPAETGTYFVKDGSGCTFSNSFTITQNPGIAVIGRFSVFSFSVSAVNVSFSTGKTCYGEATGFVQLFGLGGDGVYSFKVYP